MSRTRAILFGILAALLFAVQPVRGQQVSAAAAAAQERLRTADSTTTHIIGTRDGSTIFGRVVEARGDAVVVAASIGTLTLRLADVVSARAVRAEDVRNGEYWFPNPNTTRLLFAPTGRMLKQGEGYFSDYLIFFPGVAVGLTDRFTIGGGMSVFPGAGLDEQLFYFTPKVGLVSGPSFNLAAGVLALRAGFSDGDGNAGIVYTVGTYGGANASFTGGLGYGYADGQFADSPAVMIGGDVRLSRRFGLVSENYYFAGISDNALISLGARFFGEKMAVDFGLVGALGETEVLPFVGFVVNF